MDKKEIFWVRQHGHRGDLPEQEETIGVIPYFKFRQLSTIIIQ